MSKQIMVGNVPVGGGAPIAVQSMTCGSCSSSSVGIVFLMILTAAVRPLI